MMWLLSKPANLFSALVGVPKSSATSSLLLLDHILLLSSVQHLQELTDSESHSRVHVRLGALDMVVEVVSENLNVRNAVFSSRRNQMSREQHKGDVSHVVSVGGRLDNVPDLQRRLLLRVEHLRGVLDGSSSSINKLLQKHLSENSIGLVLEDGREDDGHSVVRRSHVDGLLVSVVNSHDLVVGLLGSVQVCTLSSSLLSERIKLVKRLLEGSGKRVSLEQCNLVDQLLSLFRVRRDRAVGEVQQQRNVVSRFRLGQELAVLPLEDLLSSALDQIGKTLDVHGDHDDGLVLGVGVGDVESHIVEIGNDLVNAKRRSLGIQPLAEHGLQQQVLVLEHQHVVGVSVGGAYVDCVNIGWDVNFKWGGEIECGKLWIKSEY